MIQGDTTVTRFNPRPLAGSDEPEAAGVLRQLVSTHAPLAGSDYSTTLQGCRVTSVSTHAPLAGSDLRHPARPDVALVSTHAPLAGSD